MIFDQFGTLLDLLGPSWDPSWASLEPNVWDTVASADRPCQDPLRTLPGPSPDPSGTPKMTKFDQFGSIWDPHGPSGPLPGPSQDPPGDLLGLSVSP
jgi:hypothetical protein